MTGNSASQTISIGNTFAERKELLDLIDHAYYEAYVHTDVTNGMDVNKKAQQEKTNTAIAALAGANPVIKDPIKLETSLGLANHFGDQYEAHLFFQDPAHLTEDFKGVMKQVFG